LDRCKRGDSETQETDDLGVFNRAERKQYPMSQITICDVTDKEE
jgi:hypothetical protein